MTLRSSRFATMPDAIPRFTVETHEVTVGDSVTFTRAGRLERILLDHFQLGRTALSGVLV